MAESEQERLRRRLRWENRVLWRIHLMLEKWDKAVDARASKNLEQLYALGEEEEKGES
jgi:hypothetical protein